MVDPPGQAFDAAFGLAPVGYLRRDCGQLRALAGHDATDERGQGGQVPSAPAVGRAWIPLSYGISYGTILTEGVTHRLLLLDGLALQREYTMGQPLKHSFQNDLAKVSGRELLYQ